MKKTITVNLNGRVFTIDEDAYQLLDNYLHNLRIHFRKEEGAFEIVADFEARIEELLSEKLRLGHQVINIEYVEEVISRVGKPSDFSEKEVEEEKQTQSQTYYQEVKKKFFRDSGDKMFGGVCSGIAAYFGWDVLVIRILFVVLIFGTSLGIVPLYLLAWLFAPEAKTAEQKLQMQGKPITVENIGKAVASETEKPSDNGNRGCLSSFVDIFGAFLKISLIGLGCLIGLPLLFALFIIVIVLFSVMFGLGGDIFDSLLFDGGAVSISANPLWAITSFCFVVGIPLVAMIYAIIAHLAKLKPVHKVIKWTSLIIWILAVILFFASGFKINKNIIKTRNFNSWNWSIGIGDDAIIKGNGILSEKEDFFSAPIDYIVMENDLINNLQIEQTASDTSSILISGDENLIDKIRYELRGRKLYLSSRGGIYNHQGKSNFIVRLQAPSLKGIKIKSIGNVSINNKFISDTFEIEMEGAGRFQADSLIVKSLKVEAEGIGSVILAGTAENVKFDLEGAGKIDALELLSSSVIAKVEGIGSIKCNPVDYFKGRIHGIGSITYKTEPKQKDIVTVGIGRIGLE